MLALSVNMMPSTEAENLKATSITVPPVGSKAHVEGFQSTANGKSAAVKACQCFYTFQSVSRGYCEYAQCLWHFNPELSLLYFVPKLLSATRIDTSAEKIYVEHNGDKRLLSWSWHGSLDFDLCKSFDGESR
jgi:hypothetical protein